MRKLFKVGCGGLVALAVLGVTVGLIAAFSGSGVNDSPDELSGDASNESSSALSVEPSGESTAGVPDGEPATLVSIIDGDTIETSQGTVRLIGIDAPERGECGYADATGVLETTILVDETVYLDLPAGQNDQDSYGRLIRYAATEHVDDLGMLLLAEGHAVARYDSSDGYPKHPREGAYREAQRATLQNGRVITTACAKQTADAAAAAPLPAAASPSSSGNWWQQYGSCAQLKRNTAGHATGPFDVNDPAELDIYNWFAYGTGHKGDGDGDGLACE